MKKKPEKTREEKVTEEFFPVDEDDLKNTTTKQFKESLPQTTHGITEKNYYAPLKSEIETVEQVSKKPIRKTKKKITKSSSKLTTTKSQKYLPPKFDLKTKGYELIITEKPQAAAKIANALGKATQKTNNKISYFEVNRDGKQIVVACAVGHLFTLKQNQNSQNGKPVFDISWVPNYLARKRDFTKKYYDTILKLAKNAGSITVATDFDIEGEVIGLNVVRFLCNQKDASRMKFSTLTAPELDKAYENKLPHLEWGQAIAGETRHYLDWFYGINLSRALMNAIKTTGTFRLMSIGRVQGPSLNLIVQREREIQNFESEKYWQVFITIKDSKNQIELKYVKDIFDKNELEKFKNLKGKTALAETKKSEQILPPNPPFNLTTLQTEAYKFYGIKPSRTLQIAQSLYLAGLISYPRTSSQKLPESIGYKDILKKLAKQFKAEKLIKREKPVEGAKSDPAHPSIYPTGNNAVLSDQDEKIYNLIVARFLSLFCENAIIDKKRIVATVDDLKFATTGSQIRKKAWLSIYPSKLKEIDVPDFEGEVEIIDQRIEDKETQPPKRFSPSSILSELEKRNLGTKATRSSIIETLFDRGYIMGDRSIEASPLGMSLITTLEKYSPIIIDEQLTRNFEDEMEIIQKMKKDFTKNKTLKMPSSPPEELLMKEDEVINKAKKIIIDISDDFEKHDKKIGKELLNANLEYREQQKRENTLLPCPVCNKGNLAIQYSKKTKRFFVACDAYPDCTNTSPLPPNGTIKKTDKVCEHCGYPMLMRLASGKKPWIFCFNMKCESNEEWANKREEKKED